MYEAAKEVGWWNSISQRVQQRETRRVVLDKSVRRAFAQLGSETGYLGFRVSPVVAEYFKMLAGSLLGFVVIGWLLALAHIRPLYTLVAFGVLYSVQATYYKHRLTLDPAFKIPKCKCGGSHSGGTETVLRSNESAVLGIPNSVLSLVLYVLLLVALRLHYPGAAIALAAIAVAASACLSYVMVHKIGHLCVHCVNMSALHLLVLLQLLR